MTEEPTSPTLQYGPIESYTNSIWHLAWKDLAEGKAADGFIITLDNTFSQHRLALNSDHPPDLQDLDKAEHIHRFNKAGYFNTIRQKEHRAALFRQLFEMSSRAVENLNFHLFKSMMLAHGAAALAALAYLGNGHSSKADWLFPVVIAFCGVGFIFSLLAARLAITANVKVQSLLVPLTEPVISESFEQESGTKLKEIHERKIVYEWPIWISVLLLIMAMVFATIGLWPNRHRTIESPAAYSTTRLPVPISP